MSRPPSRGRWTKGPSTRMTVLIGAILFIDSVFYAAIIPILGELSDEFELGKGQAGLVLGAYAAGMVIAAYPAARLVAYWGARRSVVVGLAGMSLACLVFATAESFPVLIAGRFVQGFGGACSWAGGMAWLAQSAPPERRGRMLGAVLGAGVFGSQLGPAMGALSAAIGRGPAFAGAAAVGILLMLWALGIRTVIVEPARQGARVRALFGEEFGAGLWLVAVPSACLGVVEILVPLQLADLGMTPAAIGAIFFVAAGLLAFVSRATGRAIDAAGIIGPTRLALLGSIGALLVLSVAHGEIALGAFVVVAIGCLGALWGPGMFLLANAAQRRGVDQGYASGAFLFAWAAGFAAGSAFGGAVAATGGDALPYLLSVGACVLTAVAARWRAPFLATGPPVPESHR